MKNVMTRAWEIAREGAAKFGGKVKEYFAQALVMAWAEIKKGVKKVNKSEFLKKAYEEAKNFSKENFDSYLENMKSKGVKVSNRTYDSIDMIAPNGLKAMAYSHVGTAVVVQDNEEDFILEFVAEIRFLVNGKDQQGAKPKVFKVKISDYAAL